MARNSTVYNTMIFMADRTGGVGLTTAAGVVPLLHEPSVIAGSLKGCYLTKRFTLPNAPYRPAPALPTPQS